MNIVIISPGYPNEKNPAQDVFVQNLVTQFADLGNNCFVISPQNVFQNKKGFIKSHRIDVTNAGNKIEVFYPEFCAYWNIEKFKGDPIAKSGYRSFKKAVCKIIDDNIEQVDIIYAHFLSPAGVCAADIKEKYHAKAYAAFGESSLWSLGKYGIKPKSFKLRKLDGIVSVSSENKKRLIENNIIAEEKIKVFPNAINMEEYYPRDKEFSRKKFGFDSEDFIVGFVGGFNHRKGVLRIDKAVGDIAGIKLAFAGKGDLNPESDNIVFCKPLPPKDIPFFLSAIDIFVLPTLNEGCCNAIVEAMGCGKAIISSDRPFNEDILNTNNSILIDPESVEEICEAVLLLKNDVSLRKRLEMNVLQDVQNLNIRNRAVKILEFFMSTVSENT